MSRTIEDVFALLELHDGKTINAHAMMGYLLRRFAEVLTNGDWGFAHRKPFGLAREWHNLARPLYTDVPNFDLDREFDLAAEVGFTLSEWIKKRHDEQPEGMLAAKICTHTLVLMLCSVDCEGKHPEDPADLSSADARRVIEFIYETICEQIPAVDLLGGISRGN